MADGATLYAVAVQAKRLSEKTLTGDVWIADVRAATKGVGDAAFAGAVTALQDRGLLETFPARDFKAITSARAAAAVRNTRKGKRLDHKLRWTLYAALPEKPGRQAPKKAPIAPKKTAKPATKKPAKKRRTSGKKAGCNEDGKVWVAGHFRKCPPKRGKA